MPSFAAFLPSARTRQGGLSCDGYTIRRRFGRISRLSIEKSSFERYSGRYTAQNLPPFFKRCAAAATKPSIPAVVSWNAANLPGSAFLKPQLFFRYGGFVKTQSKLPCVDIRSVTTHGSFDCVGTDAVKAACESVSGGVFQRQHG